MSLKDFWTSKSVKISLLIFTAIVAIMGLIMLIVSLSGCNSGMAAYVTDSNTKYYQQEAFPALIYEGKSHYYTGNTRWTRARFIITNTTSQKRQFTITCCIPYDKSECFIQKVDIESFADKRISFNTLTDLQCDLTY
jgi:hypothetical protein